MRPELIERISELCDPVVQRLYNLHAEPAFKDITHPAPEEITAFHEEMIRQVESEIWDKLTEGERREVFCEAVLFKLCNDADKLRQRQSNISILKEVVEQVRKGQNEHP